MKTRKLYSNIAIKSSVVFRDKMDGIDPRRMSSKMVADNLCRQPVTADKIEQLRNREEKSATVQCRENHAVAEELKKQISELAHIRKSETVDSKIKKLESAVTSLREQSKPLKKALNTALYSTDTELLELVGQTTRETLLEINGGAVIDPVDAGNKIGDALKQIETSVKAHTVDKSNWCDEWIVDDNMDEINEMYDDMYKDARLSENHRFASRLALFHRLTPELVFASSSKKDDDGPPHYKKFIQPAVYPFNIGCDFIVQLVDVERVEKQKKIREKVERGAKRKEPAALVKVSDKARNVQSEEVSISKELQHVLKVLKKELKTRKTDQIDYYELITNPTSFSRTVENMFYVSYLMRDREVYLLEENGVPILKKPTAVNDQEKLQNDERNSTHGLTPLSFEQWKTLSQKYKTTIIEPLDG